MKGVKRAASLPVAFFDRDVVEVARGLLGALLVSSSGGRVTAGRIVEVEAYLGASDPASHAYQFRRHRQNEAIYGAPGSWYVYRSYGIHWCANLVTAPTGLGPAVLIRALEPLEGLQVMRRRRGGVANAILCAGPGRLCQALGIDRALNGVAMRGSPAEILPGRLPGPPAIVATPRIGISQGREAALRFCLEGSPWLSRPVGVEKEDRGPAH